MRSMHPSRFALVLAVISLLAAACGATSSPATSAGADSPSVAASSPAASPATSASGAPSGSAGAGPDLGGAASSLEDLATYQLDIEVAGVVPAASGAGAVTIEALFDREDEAIDFSIAGASGLPGGAGELRVILIGDDAWIDPGTGVFLAQPGGASTYGQMFQQLSPETLLREVPAEGVEGAQRVGEEERNGIPSVHYIAEAGSSPDLAEEFGDEAVVHLWVAQDGGHLVGFEMTGTTDVNGTDTEVVMSFDISRINDPTIDIQPPQ
jgi:hypothetical protein